MVCQIAIAKNPNNIHSVHAKKCCANAFVPSVKPLFVAVVALVLSACSDAPTNTAAAGAASGTSARTLRIATEGSYSPYNFTQADGSLAGFDIDIANAICTKMHADCTITAQDWEGIVPALKSGRFDAIVSAMSVTPERQLQVEFSTPYFANRLVFIAPKSVNFDPTDAAQINASNIAAQRSTISSQWLDATYPQAPAKLYDTLNNAFLDLGAGRVPVMVSDEVPALEWLGDRPDFEIKGAPIDIQDDIAIAVNKGDGKLLGDINEALAQIKADGTYDKIVAQYFGDKMAK